MDNKREIELKSEKVRNIVGKIPPITLRIGIIVISVVIILVLALAYFMPYPRYYNTKIEIIIIPEYQLIRAPVSGNYYNNTGNNSHIGIIVSSDSITQVKPKIEGKILTNSYDSFYVYKNDIIAVIMPDSIFSISGICKIPTEKINEIKPSQKVNVSFSSGRSYIASVSRIEDIQQKGSLSNYTYHKVIIKFDSKLNTSDIFDTIVEGKILVSTKPILKLILHK